LSKRRYLTDTEGAEQAAATLLHCVDQMKRIALHTTEAVREVRPGDHRTRLLRLLSVGVCWTDVLDGVTRRARGGRITTRSKCWGTTS
jgi:hypothetical protein